MHASGAGQRMLTDICTAVEVTVDWLVRNDVETARRVIAEFPNVLSKCDSIDFDTVEQALAYLILHLPDRYTRAFQVLEQLLVNGALPLGKNDNFAAIDIGAGPGPGIFAIRSFYAALSHYVGRHEPSWHIATLGYSHVVERSRAMPWVMHRFAEALHLAERGQLSTTKAARPVAPNPCAGELERSRTPFGADYTDFSELDVRKEHELARRSRARELYDDDSGELSLTGAYRMAHEERTNRPSGYALAVMMNFLTTDDAIPRLSLAIDKIMRGSLVPGGTILVLGAAHGHYQDIYRELDRRARTARLTVLSGFDEPMPRHRPDELLIYLSTLTRAVWRKLEVLTGDVVETKQELRRLGSSEIYDEAKPYRLSKFRVRAYRRGK
jgi:hypothetical protein